MLISAAFIATNKQYSIFFKVLKTLLAFWCFFKTIIEIFQKIKYFVVDNHMNISTASVSL